MAVDKDEVALRYIELARAEILAKVGFVNQTLSGYLVGVAALVSWFYSTVMKGTPRPTPKDHATALIGLALMLGYLSLGANWLIHHNERVVAALAKFQKGLAGSLHGAPKMWELSDALKESDPTWHGMLTVLTEEAIVLGPPLCALWYAHRHMAGAVGLPVAWGMPAAYVAAGSNVVVAVMMFWVRFGLRE